METYDTRVLHTAGSPVDMWLDVASNARRWLDEQGIEARDACVLVPFAELLVPAKKAFAGGGGWLPRVHTTQSLSRELAPPPVQEDSGPSGDPAIDALLAGRLLREQAWGREWARRDAGAFVHAVSRVVRSAHLLMRGAQAVHPTEREGYWAQARAAAAPGAGLDRALLRAAVEWAALSGPPATDALFAHRPSAWIAVQIGGEDALAQALMKHGGVPALSLVLDTGADDPFDALPGAGEVDVLHAPDGEGEAMAAACEVVAALERGAGPVALAAEDRALVRRVRALLDRAGVPIDDETGWPLSTTRAGARVVAALRAVHPAASQDDVLDWLKSGASPVADAQVSALETLWRRGARRHDDASDAKAFLEREQVRLHQLALPRRRAVSAWLQALDELLYGGAASQAWRADAAATQLRRALRLDAASRAGIARAWLDSVLSLEAFTAWVQQSLEDARFVPESSAIGSTVVITPLSRAIGRAFGTVVVPGADAQRLAVIDSPHLLLGDAAVRALGLPDLAARRRRQAQAFVHLLRAPRVVILWRRTDGDEAQAPSPLVERLRLARRRAGMPMTERAADVPWRTVSVQPLRAPAPTVGDRLPQIWSASAVESLRQCPYQFFARTVLGLREDDELDDEVDKRDFGAWLHATLERFHALRREPAIEAEDVEQLAHAGRDALEAIVAEGQADEAALLPYTAAFDAFARRYVAWLHAHEREGWRYEAGEVAREAAVEGDGGLRLRGRIDRIDHHATQAAVHVIDYKTGAKDQLARRVNQPLEDTQLAVYAALLQSTLAPGTALSAAYLALDDSDGIVEIAHPDVAGTARELVRSLAHERQRMLAGVPLLPLGQGSVCEHCEARGLCRRDHWAAPEAI